MPTWPWCRARHSALTPICGCPSPGTNKKLVEGIGRLLGRISARQEDTRKKWRKLATDDVELICGQVRAADHCDCGTPCSPPAALTHRLDLRHHSGGENPRQAGPAMHSSPNRRRPRHHIGVHVQSPGTVFSSPPAGQQFRQRDHKQR
jgi:hypothetical protein